MTANNISWDVQPRTLQTERKLNPFLSSITPTLDPTPRCQFASLRNKQTLKWHLMGVLNGVQIEPRLMCLSISTTQIKVLKNKILSPPRHHHHLCETHHSPGSGHICWARALGRGRETQQRAKRRAQNAGHLDIFLPGLNFNSWLIDSWDVITCRRKDTLLFIPTPFAQSSSNWSHSTLKASTYLWSFQNSSF